MDTPSTPAEAAPDRPAAPTRPKRRWLRAAALAGGANAVLAGAAVAALWWWTGTDGSLATTLRWVAQWQPLATERVTGSLRAGGQVEQLVWQQDGLKVEVRGLSLAWQPSALLHGTLLFKQISAASVQIDDQRAAAPPSAGPPAALSPPLPVTLDAFSVGQLQLTGTPGATAFSASGISGRYHWNGAQHQLNLLSAQVAAGRYTGQAVLSGQSPLMLEATLSGALETAVPNSSTPLPLTFQATALGPLTDLLVKADLQANLPQNARPEAGRAKPAPVQPQAHASARIMPWAAQPLPQADADFRDLNLAVLWPDAPQTLMTGSASVRPLASTAVPSPPSWALKLQLNNRLPGPWDQQRLPLERLEAQGEWRNGAGMVRTLRAQLAGGEILANGQWAASTGTAAPAQAWTLAATLQRINPALLHTGLAALPLDGRATARSQGAAIGFDASVQSAGARPPGSKPSALSTLALPAPDRPRLRLRDASATGSWNAQQAGGTLVLSALRLRSDEAELAGQLELQLAPRGGRANLSFTAPGLDAMLKGEMRQTSGAGELSLRGRDAAQALRWLQKLPGVPAAIQNASAKGSAELKASWQGGWLDPAVQAQLEVASLDWYSATPVAASAPSASPVATAKQAVAVANSTVDAVANAAVKSAINATADAAAAAGSPSAAKAIRAAPAAAASSEPLKIRAVKASLSGRLSQAKLSTEGRVELGQRRFSLQLAAEGGRARPADNRAAPPEPVWQGWLKQLTVSVDNPALDRGGPWRLTTRAPVALKWTPGATGGTFESGSGEALLIAPPRNTPRAISAAGGNPPSQATLSWQPVRWRATEFVSAGKLTGLPMVWVELLTGTYLADVGVTGDMLLDGDWDARLGDTLTLKASLARSSGDITVQADTAQGASERTSGRVAIGVRQARVSLVSQGDAVTLALRWDSERAGTADGQLTTRLARAPVDANAGIGGWLWPVDAAVKGQFRAQLPLIGIWSVLAPPGWRFRGAFATDLAISGTRSAPELAGDLQADNLALRSVVDGIEFGNGRLRARFDGTRMRISEFTLQGAGDRDSGGRLTAQGEAGWIDGRAQVQLDARLERLRASIRIDRQITLSGDVRASLRGEQSEISGKLTVDKARILVPDEATPRLGDDVVVRSPGGAVLNQAALSAREEGRPIRLNAQLDLGQDFQVQGRGIDTRVRGALAIVGESLLNPRLTGTVFTSGGQYRAHGQRLDIERGVLRFTGPPDNPTLDILAIRPNTAQRVGVQITGTAQLPRIRLYSQPELTDAETLSWLVIGRASSTGGAEAVLLQQAAIALLGNSMSGGLAASLGFDEFSFRSASGSTEGAFTLGKRFSRNFYAAYERSVSGALSTLFIFYDLSQRFTVRAQAGQQSAVDLIFTIPFD